MDNLLGIGLLIERLGPFPFNDRAFAAVRLHLGITAKVILKIPDDGELRARRNCQRRSIIKELLPCDNFWRAAFLGPESRFIPARAIRANPAATPRLTPLFRRYGGIKAPARTADAVGIRGQRRHDHNGPHSFTTCPFCQIKA